MKPIVIYHAKCIDGFAGAWCFWSKYGDLMEYHPGVYNHKPPDVTKRDVFLVDFSYRRSVVEYMVSRANTVVLLDHHKSALDDLKDLPGLDQAHSRIENSGAKIAWDFCNPDFEDNAPETLLHIQDRDLWNFKLKHTREISEYIFSQEYDFEVWNKLMYMSHEELMAAAEIGKHLQVKHMKDIREFLAQLRRPMLIGGYEIEVACMPYTMASDAGAILSLTAPFAATYYDTKDHRCFSLRSNKSNPDAKDVSEIAFLYGGGGHKHAAGFKVKREHPLAVA